VTPSEPPCHHSHSTRGTHRLSPLAVCCVNYTCLVNADSEEPFVYSHAALLTAAVFFHRGDCSILTCAPASPESNVNELIYADVSNPTGSCALSR
jgi:hypothetical protein